MPLRHFGSAGAQKDVSQYSPSRVERLVNCCAPLLATPRTFTFLSCLALDDITSSHHGAGGWEQWQRQLCQLYEMDRRRVLLVAAVAGGDELVQSLAQHLRHDATAIVSTTTTSSRAVVVVVQQPKLVRGLVIVVS